ncbi:MAG: aliphatic sulfonates family transporter, periplasmic ligand-binding protein [Thermomicrobiales bacterium]|nr:aliphatic sulfonates family transporter, periplasmic ligand-binding protein [Thermomicrobiales bacterium]
MMIRSLHLLLAIVLAGCLVQLQPSTARAQELTPVRYAVSPFQDTLLPIIGQEMGWYEEEGLDVEFVILGWTEVQEALAAGQADVAINNISSVIATHEQWPEFVYYYGFNIFTNGAALMARPEFTSVEEFEAEGMSHEEAVGAALEQLKGQTVITASNTDMEQAVVGAAYRNGIDFESDFDIIDLNPDEGLAAFLAGQGDFYLGGIPQRTRATEEGMKAIVVGPDLAPPPINGMVTTRAYADANPEVLLKLLHVWFRIVNYVEENTAEGAEIILTTLNEQTGANMTVEGFETFWQNYEHYPLSPEEIQRDILDPSGYAYWQKRWDDCNWYFHEVRKTIDEPVAPEGVFLMEATQQAYLDQYGS